MTLKGGIFSVATISWIYCVSSNKIIWNYNAKYSLFFIKILEYGQNLFEVNSRWKYYSLFSIADEINEKKML